MVAGTGTRSCVWWLALASALSLLGARQTDAAETGVSLFAAPHWFNNTNELGQPEGWTGGFGATVLPGLRLSLFPHAFFGFELEGAAGTTTIQSVDLGAQDATILTARGHGVLRLPIGRLHVLAMAGGGIMRSSAADNVRFVADSDPYGYGGAGVLWKLTRTWRARIDGRVHWTGNTTLSSPLSREYEATISLGWSWGSDDPIEPKDDADDDDIKDELDRCPFEPETRNGVRDEDGCPEDPEIAKRVHQTQFVQRKEEQVAILPKAARSDKPPPVPQPVAATVTDADEVALTKLAPPVALADNALPPLVGPGDDDHDGLLRADDVCPDAAEDVDGFEDGDGCPDPDNDGDGVLDEVDRCPFEPELKNGIRDEDGCPEDKATAQRYHQTRYAKKEKDEVAILPEDASRITARAPAAKPLPEEDKLAVLPEPVPLAPNALPPLVSNGDDDRDGFPRDKDVCPDRAEDFDGFEDGDGCPEEDDDRDRIPDVADKCPREGETHNGYADDDGCPDDVPIPLAQRVGVLQGVEFATNSADILPKSSPVLNKVLSVLLLYRQAMVEIAGHTDDAGKREHNIELSQQRADAVRYWLVTHGADPDRIGAKGYGPDKPAASNATAKGRAKNRRVEFNLVTRGEAPQESK